MMKKLLSAVGLCCITTAVHAQENPQPGYKDSYAVDGVCYCDSNFDHGIANINISTPIGNRTVRQVCEDIEDALGTGRSSGRALYNDIQCGNGPANNAGDEDPGRCPGRVDIGPGGCDDIGPRWDLDAVYGNSSTSPNPEPAPAPPPEPTVDANGTSASNNSSAAGFAVDGNSNTRWTTETPQRPGMWFQLDLGSAETVGSVTLDSSNSPNDEPATYTLSTSTNGSNFSTAASGTGSSNGITTINFSNRSARYIRITQNGSKSRNWWSIHEMSVSESSGDDIVISDSDDARGDALNRSGWQMSTSDNSAEADLAFDGNTQTRWTTRDPQNDSQWILLDLQDVESFSQIVLDSEGSSRDFPREYTVSVSDDGSNFNAVGRGDGNDATTTVNFSEVSAQYVRIEQSGSDSHFWWSIHEVNVFR